IHPDIDKYYVATGDLKNEMVHTGIPPERIKISGIPLRETFNRVFRHYRNAPKVRP
ncbi:MAG: hypothetical protein K6T65_17090, partial [Peptococcaceae bacterium]|nr:hypothetical protein [Peptococcaceae bacterium]